MRVLLLNQYYAPDDAATAQLLADLGAGLAAAGHEVRAICGARAYRDPARRYPRRETRDGVRVERARATGFGRARAAGRLIDYASFLAGASAAVVRGPRPDVVVSLSTPPMVGLLGLVAARLRGARALYWVMDVYPDVAFALGALRPGSPAGWLLTRLSRALVRRSDTVVALGETMARRLAAGGARRVEVVHNWADGESIRPQPVAGHELRRAWGWDASFVVLYSGNLGLAHEFETLLAAAARLRDEPGLRFAVVGDGPRRAEVEAEARRLGLGNVEFRPYVAREQLGASLTAGDVHLITLRPGMPGLLVPSKIYGILAAGRPSLYVGPDEGEIADILREGGCGTRVAVGDVDGFVTAVLAYRGDAERRRSEGLAARRLFDRRFTRERALAEFRRLIETGGGADAT